MINRDRDELAWIRTDIDGEIDALSSAAERLLGVSGLRGHNLFMFFSRDSISVERDARMARTGWPNLGTARAGAGRTPCVDDSVLRHGWRRLCRRSAVLVHHRRKHAR